MSTAMAIFHTAETAAVMKNQMSTNNAVGRDYNNTHWNNGWTNPNWNWTPQPYIGDQPNPIQWDQWPYQNYPVVPQTKYYVNCPHCGRNVEQNANWTCSNCHRSLFTTNVIPAAGGFTFTWPPIPAVPQVAPPAAVEPRKTLPPPTPEPKDAQPGDGSRWEEI